MADPNVRLMNGTFYCWATHDYSINNTGFQMRDWWVWSSPDLVAWKLESKVVPTDVLLWDTDQNECWATDAALANNKYYFYLSVGGGSIAVVVADSPAGPWSDPLGKPLLDAGIGSKLHPPTTFRDPCVFQDDDGTWYIIAGVFEYYIAKLADDMISLAEEPRHVTVTGAYGACGANKTDDKPFIHRQGTTYYLSWGCFYGMSSSVYGPYATQGSVVATSKIDPAFRIGGLAEPWCAPRVHGRTCAALCRKRHHAANVVTGTARRTTPTGTALSCRRTASGTLRPTTGATRATWGTRGAFATP